jgi:dTMP kinase
MDGESKGIFIVVDGIDGAGKTTQVQRLCEVLESVGEVVVSSKEPTSGPWGQKLRASAVGGRMELREELAAFIADRKEHVATVIQPALDAGKIVIVDRYFYSTIAYQGSRGADIQAVESDMRSMFPAPDVVFLLDADPVITLHRVESGRGDTPNHFERLDQLQAVRAVFLDLAHRDPTIRIVDASHSIDAVFSAVVRVLVDGVLKQKRCAKSYDCDVFYCTPRLAGECQWANITPGLLEMTRPTALVK